MNLRRGPIELLAAVLFCGVALSVPPDSGGSGNGAVHAAAADGARVVSIGGAITEILYALDLGERIVAVDSTSYYPSAATDLPDVGYMRRLSAEPILALNPTLLLAAEYSGPPAVLDQLREAGLRVELVADHPSLEGVVDKVARVAAIMGEPERGAALVERIQTDVASVVEKVRAVRSRPGVLFLFSVGQGGAPPAAGRDTAADAIIDLAGGVNVADGFEGYKALSPEALVAAAPEVILVTERSLSFLGGKDGLLELPAIETTPAGRDHKIVTMDGLLLLGFGPRVGMAARELARHLHPEISWEAAVQ